MLANHEDLNQAIIKSDLAQVKEILETTTKLSKEKVSSLASMAQNIIHGRLMDKKIAIIPEVILGLPGIIITLKSLAGILSLGFIALSTTKKYETPCNTVNNINSLKHTPSDTLIDNNTMLSSILGLSQIIGLSLRLL